MTRAHVLNWIALAAAVGVLALPLAAAETPLTGNSLGRPAAIPAPMSRTRLALRQARPSATHPVATGLTQEDVAAVVARAGYKPTGEARRRGDYFVTVAEGPDGGRFDLVVDGQSGAIDGVRRRRVP